MPLVALALVCLFGAGLRSWHLGIPQANSATGAGYVFDERYYVAAAEIIAGEAAGAGNIYAGTAPAGADPNGEHPQLGKMIIAAGIAFAGNNAIGWRIGAVLFGLAALALLYWLVRCAGGTPWLAVGASAIASVDNLWLVHSRIAVLDIYVVPFMLAGAAFYLRRQPLVAGALIGIGCCVKEFAAYTLFVLVALELMRMAGDRFAPSAGAPPAVPVRRRLRSLLGVAAVTGLCYVTLLAALDTVVTPYSGGRPVDRGEASWCADTLIWSEACNHIVFMARYAAQLHGSGGIASAPPAWWLDRKAITYFELTKTIHQPGAPAKKVTVIWYRGEISRVLLYTSWAALLAAAWWAIRRRDDLSFLVLAWALGTWLPAELSHAIDNRTTYLYYMVVTMPALYIGTARLLASKRIPWLVVAAWAAALLIDGALLYPIRTLSGT
jgi:hypothetical protein